MRSLALLSTILFAAPALLFAHTQQTGGTPTMEVRAVRSAASPVIDGRLDDEVWRAAPEITSFTQRDPDEGAAVSQPTSVRITYDEEAIYFGARLDDSQRPTILLGRRDSRLRSDWFAVYIDSHHDHRSGASFAVNPANVQYDEVLYNDNYSDDDWDAVWSSAVQVDEGGWTVEMRIPYSQLRFPNREIHTWGINFRRDILRRNENAWLASAPKSESLGVSRYAHMVGIEEIRPARALEIVPYGVARADLLGSVRSDDPLLSQTDFFGDAGVDVKYGITSNLTLTGTLNPDFGQVEVDPAVVNLSQFETFFPEKRPFFLEGATLFDFGRGGSNNNFNFNLYPPQLFYSRRIGRSPQGTSSLAAWDFLDAPSETTILGAGKITGKSGNGWSIGVIDAVTEREEARLLLDGAGSRVTVEPLTNYLVGRIARDLGSKGRLGALFTAVNRDLDDETGFLREAAYTGGVDGYWAFGNRDVIWEWFAGGSVVEGSSEAIIDTQTSSARYYQRPDAAHVELDPSRTSLTGWAARTAIAKQTGKWRYNLAAQSYSPGFETNDVGFMPRTDIIATHGVLMYVDPETRGRIRQRNIWAGKFQNWNHDGDLISNGLYGNAWVLFANYWDAGLRFGRGFGSLDDRATRGGPLMESPADWVIGGEVDTDSRKTVSYEAGFETWGDDAGGNGYFVGGAVRYRPGSRLSLRLEPSYVRRTEAAQYVTTVADATAATTYGSRYVFATLEQRTLELSTRLDWTYSSTLTVQLYLQPFVSAGDYHSFKELARPRSFDFDRYGIDSGSIAYGEGDDIYTVDPDGAGAAPPFSLGDPDFNFRSLRGSAVVRWEFRPGSALYVVWNENRAEVEPVGEFRARRDFSALGRAESDDVFLIKLSYWLPL